VESGDEISDGNVGEGVEETAKGVGNRFRKAQGTAAKIDRGG
jgi:hypothetical protein